MSTPREKRNLILAAFRAGLSAPQIVASLSTTVSRPTVFRVIQEYGARLRSGCWRTTDGQTEPPLSLHHIDVIHLVQSRYDWTCENHKKRNLWKANSRTQAVLDVCNTSGKASPSFHFIRQLSARQQWILHNNSVSCDNGVKVRAMIAFPLCLIKGNVSC